MKSRATRKNITKFILATAIFYAMLVYNVFHVGESIAPQEKDYTSISNQALMQTQTSGEQYIQEIVEEISNESAHGAANDLTGLQAKFEAICEVDSKLCKNIDFDGVFSIKEKLIYLSSIFKVTQFIDKYIITQQEVNASLHKIALNKDAGKRRGYATRDTILLNLGAVENNKEFIELISHEMGHILDLGMLQGSNKKKDIRFTEFGKTVFSTDDISLLFYGLSWDGETIRKANAVKKDFCSGYGMSDPFEDLAECLNLYAHHNALFQKFAIGNKIMKKKYNFIAALFNGTYMAKGTSTLSANTRPRDTTKIN